MKGVIVFSLVPLLALASPVLVDSIDNEAAPVLSSTLAEEIPDSYIVIFKKNVTANTAILHHGWVQDQHAQVEIAKSKKRSLLQDPLVTLSGFRFDYNFADFLGYTGHFDVNVVDQIRRHPDVRDHPRLGLFLY